MRRLPAVIMILVVIGAGCATAQQPVPVTDSTRRFVLQGFSVLPPKGENWLLLKQGVDHIVFGKQLKETGSRGDSVIAAVDTLKVDARVVQSQAALLAFVERWSKEGLFARLRPLRFKATLDRSLGAECVQSEGAVEDTGVPQFPGSVFTATSHDFHCLHPYTPGLVVRVGYSTRFLQGLQVPPAIEAEGVPFLKSLMFNAAK